VKRDLWRSSCMVSGPPQTITLNYFQAHRQSPSEFLNWVGENESRNFQFPWILSPGSRIDRGAFSTITIVFLCGHVQPFLQRVKRFISVDHQPRIVAMSLCSRRSTALPASLLSPSHEPVVTSSEYLYLNGLARCLTARRICRQLGSVMAGTTSPSLSWHALSSITEPTAVQKNISFPTPEGANGCGCLMHRRQESGCNYATAEEIKKHFIPIL
jgi:hypothetical protein